ncbi:hypothetical protein [Janibacter terrae]|uniref:hypothetical protein n=1 Tax=Janibacter terrae TaxID=103817 RepID=UPI0031F802D5
MNTQTRTVTEQDVEQAWAQMPDAFRQTHPLPSAQTWQAGQEWSAKVRRDCNAVIVVMLETATADLARGDLSASRIVHSEVRPFERLKRMLDAVEAQQAVRA